MIYIIDVINDAWYLLHLNRLHIVGELIVISRSSSAMCWRFHLAACINLTSADRLRLLLVQVLEEKFQLGNSYPIRNPQAVLMLIEWLPDIESLDLQLWLSTCVRSLCASSTHNAMLCCNEGMIATILSVLARHRQIDSKAIGLASLRNLFYWVMS